MGDNERSYGHAVSERMDALRVGVVELATMTGLSRETIRRIVAGQTQDPGIRTRRKIDAALSRPPGGLADNVGALTVAHLTALSEQMLQMQASLELRLDSLSEELVSLRGALAQQLERQRVAAEVFDVAP